MYILFKTMFITTVMACSIALPLVCISRTARSKNDARTADESAYLAAISLILAYVCGVATVMLAIVVFI